MSFSIIRHAGEQRKAVSLNGDPVVRKDAFFISDWLAFVKCAPYDNHFLYENNHVDQPAYLCTCGSAAGVVPPTLRGTFVCLYHYQHGVHQGDSKWV